MTLTLTTSELLRSATGQGKETENMLPPAGKDVTLLLGSAASTGEMNLSVQVWLTVQNSEMIIDVWSYSVNSFT